MEVKQVLPGWVLVEIDDSNEFVKFGDGKLWIDTSFEPEKHAQTKGTIIASCKTDIYCDWLPDGTEIRHEHIVTVGDNVIFHFLCVRDAVSHGRYFIDGNRKLLFIRYEELYLVMRKKEVIPINGWVLIAPLEAELPKTTLHIPAMLKGKKTIDRGIVKYVGCPYGYFNHGQLIGMDKTLMVGDEVYFHENDSIPVQYEMHAEIGVLYRMKRHDCVRLDKVSLKVA